MKKNIVLISITLLVLGALFLTQYMIFNNGKFEVIFCQVGQGDAILMKTPNGRVILFDAGPSEKVVECLEKNLPFWKRDIDIFLLSHPHADHYLGMHYLIDRYINRYFVTENLLSKDKTFQKLFDRLNKQTPVQFLLQGDKFTTDDGVLLTVLSPDSNFLKSTSTNDIISESGEFASLIVLVSYGSFDLLLTGDTQARQLSEAIAFIKDRLDVIQVPHHGSKTGLTQEIIKELSPELAVISVGKNRYGHPAQEVLDLLQNNRIKVLRTDQNGNVHLLSDGKTWFIKN